MKSFQSIILGVLFIASAFSAFKISENEKIQQQYKADIIELSSVEYGLLNVDHWEKMLAEIIASKLQNFTSEPTNKEDLKKNVAALLKTLIDDYEKSLQKKNSKNLFGSLTNSLYSSAFDGIREDIPMLTDKVMTFLDLKNNKEGLTKFIVVLLKEYTEGTFAKTDYTAVNAIIKKYEGNERADTVKIIEQKTIELNNDSQIFKVLLLGIFACFVVLFFFFKDIYKMDYVFGICFSFVLLFLGVTLPMIEIDARISEISFSFLNESMSFNNQVLFYQSKSIYEVVTLMLAQHSYDIIAVGILIFLFSVLFPITKLVSSILYLISQKLKENKLIQFFIFKTGKWSMADVFVIAIIMAFIGFEGIISDQLSQLENVYDSVSILTTNNSSVLFGFYAFTAFVIISLTVSLRLHKVRKSA